MIISHKLMRTIHAQPAIFHGRHNLSIAIGSPHTNEIQKTEEGGLSCVRERRLPEAHGRIYDSGGSDTVSDQ